MKTASILDNIQYGEGRPAISVMMDSEAGKEIRIVFKKGQVMQKHQAPFPITVQVFDGCIDFGVDGEVVKLNRGDMITLPGKMPHDLTAVEDSIVRLSLSTADTSDRVHDAVNQ